MTSSIHSHGPQSLSKFKINLTEAPSPAQSKKDLKARPKNNQNIGELFEGTEVPKTPPQSTPASPQFSRPSAGKERGRASPLRSPENSGMDSLKLNLSPVKPEESPVKSAGRNISFDREQMRQVFNESLKKVQEDEIVEKNREMAREKKKKEEAQKLQRALNRERCWLRMIKSIERFYTSAVFTVFLSATIFLSLFIRDLWIVVFEGDSDGYSDTVMWSIFLIFLIESILNSVMFSKYRFSFVFLLDTVSTLTILLDITSLPMVADQDYKKVKQSLFFRIFKLFSVLKLWRATRLFFRKNQTKEYIPITENTVGLNQADFVNKLKNMHFLNQSKRLSMAPKKPNPPPRDATPTSKSPSNRNPKESYLVLPNRSAAANLNDSAMNKLEYSFHVERDGPSSKIGLSGMGLQGDSKHNLSLLIVKPEITVHGEQLEPEQAQPEQVQIQVLDRSHAESARGKALLKSNQTLRGAVLRGAQKTVGFNIHGYNKEKERAVLRASNNEFILNNRLEASGNIRKTIAYRNVGTIACTVLMANLGLSVFVSSLYYDNPSICSYDLTNAFDLLAVEANRANPQVFRAFYDHKVAKYSAAGLQVLAFRVGELLREQRREVAYYREDEMIRCSRVRRLGGVDFEVEVVVDNHNSMLYTSLFNILRNVFTVVILIYNILMNNRDIKGLIMDPIEHIYEESSQLSVHPLVVEDTMVANRALFSSRAEVNTEWVVISKLLNFSTNWLINIFGTSSENYLCKAINFEDFDLKKNKGEEVYGVYCYLDSAKLSTYLAKLVGDCNFVQVYNRCLGLIHQEVSLMRGEIYSLLSGQYLFAWHFSDAEMVKEGDPKEDLSILKSSVTSKAELAVTALISALFKLRVFLRNYTYTEHDKLSFRLDGLVSLSVHSGWAIKGPAGGLQKVDLSMASKSIFLTKKLATLATRYKCDVVFTEQVFDMLSPQVVSAHQTAKLLFEIDKFRLESIYLSEGPYRIYTIQMNDRMIDGFEMTALDSDFILFKKTRAEKMIFRKFKRKDCYFRILKPNLARYLVNDEEIHELYETALEYAVRRQFDLVGPYLEQIRAIARTEFRPAEVLALLMDRSANDPKYLGYTLCRV